MADVTISQLNRGIPSINALLPYSQGGVTLSSSISSLSDFKPIFSGQITDGSTNNATSSSIFKYNNVIVHRGNWYNSSTGRLTAPIDGIINVRAYCLLGSGGSSAYSQTMFNFRINEVTVAAGFGAGTYWNTGIITSTHSIKRNDILDFWGPDYSGGATGYGGYIYGGGYNNFSIEYI